MTREEALSQIVDALDNIEEFDEALTILRTETGEEDATTWKQKYDDLAEKYKTRFKSEITGNAQPQETKPKEETKEDKKPATIEELDFSAETE